ncbi:unnamed protein product, partial [Adineta steineri]
MVLLTLMLMISCMVPLYKTDSINLYEQQIGKQDTLQSDLLFNCSGLKTDDDILQSFPFKVELNPIIQSPEITLMILPEFMGNLSSLRFLSLPNNMLTSLPTTIVNNQLLRQIELGNNPNLSSIQSLNGHPSIKYIEANNCSIENLPVNLSQLTDLYMSNNKLKNLRNIQTSGRATNARKYFYFGQNRIQSITPQI